MIVITIYICTAYQFDLINTEYYQVMWEVSDYLLTLLHYRQTEKHKELMEN